MLDAMFLLGVQNASIIHVHAFVSCVCECEHMTWGQGMPWPSSLFETKFSSLILQMSGNLACKLLGILLSKLPYYHESTEITNACYHTHIYLHS